MARKAAGTISGIGIDYPRAPRAADVPLMGSRRLYEALRDGRFVLLAPDSAAPQLAGLHDRVTLAPPTDTAIPWTLVRPDAHIAWRGGSSKLDAALVKAGLNRAETVRASAAEPTAR